VTIPDSSKPRRQFLKFLAIGTPAALALRTVVAATNEKKTVHIVQFDAAGIRTSVVEMEKVAKPPSEWKKQLTAEQFEITRQAGTERPGTGKYAYNHEDGRRVSSTLRHLAWEFSDFLPLSFGRLVAAC
jgi:peptide-methionine (R)-S-oxide reductase